MKLKIGRIFLFSRLSENPQGETFDGDFLVLPIERKSPSNVTLGIFAQSGNILRIEITFSYRHSMKVKKSDFAQRG
jgi:hypothetical protein